MFKRPVLLLASFVFLIPSIQLLAESRIADRGPRIVVSANRTETSAKDIGGAVTVYTREEIERSQKHYVLDLLRETPGIDVVRSGGPGGNTALFMRGANSEHTLVILDGLELNNPGSTSRSYNLANLTLDNIERIEVIRGPQSSLYGSDAIGGVIVLTTRQGGDGLHGSTSFEGGSFSTFHETASVNGAIDEGVFLSRFLAKIAMGSQLQKVMEQTKISKTMSMTTRHSLLESYLHQLMNSILI